MAAAAWGGTTPFPSARSCCDRVSPGTPATHPSGRHIIHSTNRGLSLRPPRGEVSVAGGAGLPTKRPWRVIAASYRPQLRCTALGNIRSPEDPRWLGPPSVARGVGSMVTDVPRSSAPLPCRPAPFASELVGVGCRWTAPASSGPARVAVRPCVASDVGNSAIAGRVGDPASPASLGGDHPSLWLPSVSPAADLVSASPPPPDWPLG
jgi:hypothetical protein